MLTLGKPQGVQTLVDLPGFKAAAPGSNGGMEEIVTARIDTRSGMLPAAGMATTRRGVMLDTGDRGSHVGPGCAARRPLVDSSEVAVWWSRWGQLASRARCQRAGGRAPGAAQRARRVTSLRRLDSFARLRPSRSPRHPR